MRLWFFLLSLLFGLCALGLWVVPSPWDRAEGHALRDTMQLMKVADQPDQLAALVAENPAILHAVIWDADGGILFPNDAKFADSARNTADETLQQLVRWRDQADPSLWQFPNRDTFVLVRCSAEPPLCLTYDRQALQVLIGSGPQGLSTQGQWKRWMVLALCAAVACAVTGVVWRV